MATPGISMQERVGKRLAKDFPRDDPGRIEAEECFMADLNDNQGALEYFDRKIAEMQRQRKETAEDIDRIPFLGQPVTPHCPAPL